MKSNLVKKIVSSAIIAIILAIVTTTIVLALVQKTLYNPINYTYYDKDLKKDVNYGDTYYSLTLCKDKFANMYLKDGSDEQKEVINKIAELQKDSTKASILSHMLQGSSFESEVKVSDAGNVMTKIAKAEGEVCLIYDFIDEQKLYFDGEVYKNSQAKDPDAPVTFRKIFIPISNTEEFETCTAYLTGSDNISSYQITFLAHQSEIYQYMISLTWDFTQE